MRTYVFDVPEGTMVGQILVTLYELRDFEDVPEGEWKPEERMDVAVRPKASSVLGPNVWSPPLDMSGRS